MMDVCTADLLLVNATEFDKAYFREAMTAKTNVEAYERVEKRYQDIFHKRRYKNYESYRKSRYRRLKD